jgi:hypothetical protein
MDRLPPFTLICRTTGVVIALLVAGCGKGQTAPPPGLSTGTTLSSGSPLSGPVEGSTGAPGEVTRVAVEWVAMSRMPDDVLAPVDVRSDLTISPQAGAAVLPTGRMTRTVLFGQGPDADAFVQKLRAGAFGQSIGAGSSVGLVAAGTTLTFNMDATDTGGRAGRASLSVYPKQTSQGGPSTQPSATTTASGTVAMLAITVTGRPVRTDRDDESKPANDASSDMVPETALLDDVPYATGATFAVVTSLKANRTPWTALAAIVRVSDAGPQADAAREVEQQLRASAVRTGAASTGIATTALRTAIAELSGGSASPRASLLFLASACDAHIAGDWALVASDDMVGRFARHVATVLSPDVPPQPKDLQWLLDRTAVQWMCDAAAKDELSRELTTVLASHAGDVARRPDALLELIASVNGTDELNARLVAENYIALEDSSPAARVRAFDWLKAIGREPRGYDPLADARSRRAAIDNAVGNGATP